MQEKVFEDEKEIKKEKNRRKTSLFTNHAQLYRTPTDGSPSQRPLTIFVCIFKQLRKHTSDHHTKHKAQTAERQKRRESTHSKKQGQSCSGTKEAKRITRVGSNLDQNRIEEVEGKRKGEENKIK